MAGLKKPFLARSGRLAAGLAFALVLIAGCQPTLSLRELVEREVEYSKIGLVLYDGVEKILPGDTVSWPDTIFTEPSTKTITLRNNGSKNVTLSGPLVVSKTGGSGQAAYGGIVQPVQLTLTPGSSTSFSVDFTPASPDADYSCDFVVNSNDGTNPAYVFSGLGHSTQWHGSGTVISSPTSAYYYSPQIALAPSSHWASPGLPTLVVAFYQSSGVYLAISRDGGMTWPAVKLAVASTSVDAVSLGVSANVHLFYQDNSSGSRRLYYTIASLSSLFAATGDYTGYFLTNYLGTFPYSHFYNIKNSNIAIANANVYLAYYNSTASKLQLACRPDSIPFEGIPSFAFYDVTGINGQTGGESPAIQVDSSKLYIIYEDGQYARVSVIALSSLASPGSYNYYTVANNGSGRSLWSSGLAMDGARGFALWRLDGGSPIYSAASSNMTLSSWSAAAPLSGESTATISAAQTMPFLLADGILHTIYFRSSPQYGVRFSSSADGGSNWSSRWLDDDSSFSGSSSEVALTAFGPTIYALFTTQSASHPHDYSVTIMKSLDGGATW